MPSHETLQSQDSFWHAELLAYSDSHGEAQTPAMDPNLRRVGHRSQVKVSGADPVENRKAEKNA